MSEALELLRGQLVQDALKASLLVGIVCAYLGVFIILKRIVFVGAALAEVASLGQSLALLPAVHEFLERACLVFPVLHILDHIRPLALAVLFMLAAVALLSQVRLWQRLPREAVIGALFAGATGLTFLVLSKVQAQGQHNIDLLAGNVLGVDPREMLELSLTAAGVLLVQLLFRKEFVLVSYDPEVARTLGYRAGAWELLWYLTLGLMIAVSIHVAGTVLVFAFLVLPAATALQLSRRMGVVLMLAVLTAVVSVVVGLVVGLHPAVDVPLTYSMVSCATLIFAAVWLARNLTTRLRLAQ